MKHDWPMPFSTHPELSNGKHLANAAPFTGADFDPEKLAAATQDVLAHPAFEAALQCFCTGMIASFEGQRLANRLMGDAGRFALMAICFLLEEARRTGAEPHGATTARIAELLARRKLASPRATHSLIAMLRLAGALEPVSGTGDQRMRPLRPTALMIGQASRWLSYNLRGAAMIALLPGPVEALLAEPGFVAGYFARMGQPYVQHGFILYDGFPQIEQLMGRFGGYQMMLELTRSAVVSPTGALFADASIGALSDRLKFSRSQMRSILDMATREGWLNLHGRPDRAIEITPSFHALCRLWVARELAWSAELARHAAGSVSGRMG
jgi:hypothetical protein